VIKTRSSHKGRAGRLFQPRAKDFRVPSGTDQTEEAVERAAAVRYRLFCLRAGSAIFGWGA